LKKDIIIPGVQNVYVAIVNEYNHIHQSQNWNVYIINDKLVDLELVLIVSSGELDAKVTSIFRKKIDKLPSKSYAKIEMIQEELFVLNNSFKISFFEKNVMCDKTFIFPKNTITKDVFQELPVMNERGILAE
jgi:hypothetical protein